VKYHGVGVKTAVYAVIRELDFYHQLALTNKLTGFPITRKHTGGVFNTPTSNYKIKSM